MCLFTEICVVEAPAFKRGEETTHPFFRVNPEKNGYFFLTLYLASGIIYNMRQHKKNLGLCRINLSIPKEIYEWLKTSAKAQSLYLTEILEMVKNLKENA